MQQAFDALTHHRQQTTFQFQETNAAIKALEDELAKPEPAINPFPSFIRRRIEEAIDLAINPTGMSTHDGKATVYAADLQRMLAVIDLAPPRKEWVGLTEHEIWECQKPGLSDDVYKLIEAKLRERNT
jgi:hypothetical protein